MGTMKEVLSKGFIVTLIMFFGEGSWIAINAVWVELPLLVELGIPEKFGFASWTVVIIQLSNVGLVIFTVANYFTSKGFQLEVPVNYFITASGCVLTVLLIFFWDDYTVWSIDGKLHSTAFFIIIFFLALMACTSNVAFIPFMTRFQHKYVTWYFIGMAMSGVTPSLIALIQGVDDTGTCIANGTFFMVNETEGVMYNCTEWIPQFTPARFGPSVYFFVLFLLMCSCFVAYVLLNFSPIAQNKYAETYKKSHLSKEKGGREMSNVGKSSSPGYDPLPKDEVTVPNTQRNDDAVNSVTVKMHHTKLQLVYIFVTLALTSSLTNCVLPSIQSFSAGAYGLKTYLYASTFGCMSNPLGAILVMLKPIKSLLVITLVVFVGLVAGIYCMTAALMSPEPPLQNTTIGEFLIVLAWVISLGSFSFTKSSFGWILRNEPNNRVLLIWYGVIVQAGSFIGALVIFPLVNFTDLFVAVYKGPCDDTVMCVQA